VGIGAASRSSCRRRSVSAHGLRSGEGCAWGLTQSPPCHGHHRPLGRSTRDLLRWHYPSLISLCNGDFVLLTLSLSPSISRFDPSAEQQEQQVERSAAWRSRSRGWSLPQSQIQLVLVLVCLLLFLCHSENLVCLMNQSGCLIGRGWIFIIEMGLHIAIS
jgi:hypothetical protein